MNEEKSLIIDVLEIFPVNSICYIQAPSLENVILDSLLVQSEYPQFRRMILTSENKRIFIELFRSENIEMYFQTIEIKCNNSLLFEAFDGIEIGIISKEIDLPEWFVTKYVRTGMCNISEEW